MNTLKRIALLFTFVCALAVSSLAQSTSDITISGTLYNAFNDPCTSCTFTVTVTRRDGVAVQSSPKTITSNGTTGAVSFTMPRKSIATFTGNFTVGKNSWKSGISLFIPDQSTVDIVDLQSVEDAIAALTAVSAAPSDAQYIVGTANGTLSAEQSLGALTTGLLKNTVSGSTGTLSTATAGTDYENPLTFAARLSRSTNTIDLAASGVTAGTCTACDLTIDTYGRVTAKANGSGGGTVSSVFGRTGAVAAATNDYTWAQIDKTTSSLADITTRSASDLSSGTLAAARGGAGAVSGILKADGSGVVSAATGGTDYVVPGGALGTPSSGVATNLTGTASGLTAGAATVLATARTINGTSFDGSANITVTAAAGTLTGATLNSGVTASSLTSFGSSPTITTPTISGAITFPDGVRQTFNPDGTNAGINVGSQAGDPSAPSNGDLWYDSTANELTARINGANVALGAGGGSGITIGTTTITSGTAGRLLYETSGNVVGEVAGSSADANGALTLATTARSSGVAAYLTVTAPADTGLTASAEAIGVNFAGATRQHATGAITTQREYVFGAPTYSFAGASTITNAATVSITSPAAGTNATITNPYALLMTGVGTSGKGVVRVNGSSGNSFTQINDNGTVVIDSDVSTGTNPLVVRYNGSQIANIGFAGDMVAVSFNAGSGIFTASSSSVNINSNTVPLRFGASNDVVLKRGGAAAILAIEGASSVAATISTPALSPAQITADQNNYTPGTGWFQRWSSDASRNITGLAAGQAGQMIEIWNVGSQNIVLQNQNASSTAANRFLTSTGADLTLTPDKCAQARYDSTTARWRVYLCN